jgi:hypothetical protein
VLSAHEGHDDEHRRAAALAHEGGPGTAVIGAVVAGVSGKHWYRLMQKIASGGDIVVAVGVGEQAVVADAVNAGGQLAVSASRTSLNFLISANAAKRTAVPVSMSLIRNTHSEIVPHKFLPIPHKHRPGGNNLLLEWD